MKKLADILANLKSKLDEAIKKLQAEYASGSLSQPKLMLITASVLVTLTVLGYTLSIEGESLNAGTLAFWSSVFYFGSSFRTVVADENAALTLFGRPIQNVTPGLNFVPLGICELIFVSSIITQREFPGEPQNIYRGELKEGDVIPEEKVPPVRIQFRDSVKEEDLGKVFSTDELSVVKLGHEESERVTFNPNVPEDGLSQRVVAELFVAVRIYISDPCSFIRNIGDIEEAFSQIEDELFAVLNSLCTRISVGQALGNVKWIEAHLFNAVSKLIGTSGNSKSWGINLDSSSLKSIHTSHGVNTAISEAASAQFGKQKTITDAQANAVKISTEGEAEAGIIKAKTRAEIDGKTEGLLGMARDLELSGKEVVAADVANSIAEGDNAIILGDAGAAGLVGLAQVAGKALESQKGKDE